MAKRRPETKARHATIDPQAGELLDRMVDRLGGTRATHHSGADHGPSIGRVLRTRRRINSLGRRPTDR